MSANSHAAIKRSLADQILAADLPSNLSGTSEQVMYDSMAGE
eukprot:gene879-11484_t